ncbi:hypothetical protein EPA93_36940 [Ktedonosporobacter rubrisoli]|uniref:Glycoside hydrolase family 42 N-terminal domain-containing protein n=1 Tax=Ktedonosporobacter rubrisoli TaxID=2509675 RepID=A0A4P6JZL3_KTERU|nr:hypothetical protein [Ktedonosporobacter rubrisoli]QBD81267.1 hypothetical protein EPA93_36940 [Ktedonosporobacter rubrisoli]
MLKRPSVIILIVVIIGCIVLAALAYNTVIRTPPQTDTAGAVATPKPTLTPTPQITKLPVQSPDKVLGIEGSPDISYKGISWVRLGYPSCGWGDLKGQVLKDTIEDYHRQGARVLLTVCQGKNDASLYDTAPLQDAAQGRADAVQCGNEEMKVDPNLTFLYIPPENFAKFYDLCEHAVHNVREDIPVLLGSLDPHVGGIDHQPLLDQVQYLNQMQTAMNTSVRPGGNWDWRKQTLGLIDSWHNGYPDASVNSLQALFSFWAQQFHVDLNSGDLGKHLWVVEGTGCFKGCGLDVNNNAQIAVSHILTLITDVQTAMKYKIPFFYFSGKDFDDQGYHWPIGIVEADGNDKPIRQDLSMGARTLNMTCSNGKVKVTDQEQLLAKLYAHCTLPENYLTVLTS